MQTEFRQHSDSTSNICAAEAPFITSPTSSDYQALQSIELFHRGQGIHAPLQVEIHHRFFWFHFIIGWWNGILSCYFKGFDAARVKVPATLHLFLGRICPKSCCTSTREVSWNRDQGSFRKVLNHLHENHENPKRQHFDEYLMSTYPGLFVPGLENMPSQLCPAWLWAWEIVKKRYVQLPDSECSIQQPFMRRKG